VPTYQYVCTSCGRDLEVVQSFTDTPLTDCPACAGRLRKRFSAVGVVFKGSGFYKTDSRSAKGKRAEKAPVGATAGGSGAESGGSGAESGGSGGESGGSGGESGKTPTTGTAAAPAA
jgi:putative FmdB family regulatory protein